MSKIPVLYKTLVIGVIVLFIGIGIQSAIATEEIQEYTLMTPNIFGLKKQKITLTPEQVNKLNSIFDNLQEELQDVDSVEETKLIYKRTIDILVHNGLLSKSDAFQTKKLMFSSIVDRFYSALNKKLNIDTDIENSNCYVTGETKNHSEFWRPITHLIAKVSSPPLNTLIFIKWLPIVFFTDISFGYWTFSDHWDFNYWSRGWVKTENNYGSNFIAGNLRGGLGKIVMFGIPEQKHYFVGVYFFMGIGFSTLSKNYFLGRAAVVDVYEKPDD